MDNTLLQSVSSQLYCYGNNDLAISDVPRQMDRKRNVFSRSIIIDAELLYNDNGGLLEGVNFAFPSQSPIDYQPAGLDYPYMGGGYIPQQPFHLSKKLSVPQFEVNIQAVQNARKRPIEVSDLIPEAEFNDMVSNKPAAPKHWMMINKKKKVDCLQDQQWHVKEASRGQIQRQRVPGRRSQKLSDRITSLQKLVSPYGKTDTASVLEEASLSIKALQDQIQNLFQIRSTSHISTKPWHSQKTREKQQHSLHSRGLRLVPVSIFTQNLTKEEKQLD